MISLSMSCKVTEDSENLMRVREGMTECTIRRDAYSSSGTSYDNPGLRDKASATLREIKELSNLLRMNMDISLSVGGRSTTDLPSAEGTSTASKESPTSSERIGISTISQYLTAMETSCTSHICRGNQNVLNPFTVFFLSGCESRFSLLCRGWKPAGNLFVGEGKRPFDQYPPLPKTDIEEILCLFNKINFL
jgi:hypothetical protein